MVMWKCKQNKAFPPQLAFGKGVSAQQLSLSQGKEHMGLIWRKEITQILLNFLKQKAYNTTQEI